MKRKIIAAIISGCMLLSNGVSPLEAETNDQIWKEKVDERVLEKMSNCSDKIGIYIFLEDLDDEKVSEQLLEQGIDDNLFTDKEKFEEVLVPEVTEEVISEVGVEKAYEVESNLFDSSKKGFSLLKDSRSSGVTINKTMIESRIEQRVDNYKQVKREIIKDMCLTSNDEFIDKNNITENDIIYKSSHSKTLIVNVQPEEIQKFAQMEEVSCIGLYEKLEVVSKYDIIMDQICASRTNGTKSNGYTGKGIKIGIVEANDGRFDPNNPHLSGNSNIHCLNPGNTTISEHASVVTSVIAGKHVDGYYIESENYSQNNNEKHYRKSFEGIVPDATVYQIGAKWENEILDAINRLVDEGVDVINCSIGVAATTKYTAFDKEIDSLVKTNDIIFVNAAGNEGEFIDKCITSPGYAYNVITVGNLKTVGDDGNGMIYPYAANSQSSFKEPSYQANKPDISAPGTNVFVASCKDSSGEIGFLKRTGTSLSAPLVTGVIAQMLQANVYLKANPTMVKAKLLLAARDNVINSTDNSFNGKHLRDKTGAGMVDAEDSVELVTNNYDNAQIKSINVGEMKTVAKKQFVDTQKVRIVMVFDNPNNILINSRDDVDDIDLYLKDSNGTILASSTSANNNVEIIEYYITKTGYYSIDVKAYKRAKNYKGMPTISIAWE